MIYKTKEELMQELVNIKFSDSNVISDEKIIEKSPKVKLELEEIAKKKQVDYEKLNAVIKL